MKAETLLLRQVNPGFILKGKISSQAFLPFPKDQGLLSVYDGDLISAAEAFRHYTGTLRLRSEGVWGITCAEIAATGLTARPDPLDGFSTHAVIDFTRHNKVTRRIIARTLLE